MTDKNDLLHFAAKCFADKAKKLIEVTKILNDPNCFNGKQIKIVKGGMTMEAKNRTGSERDEIISRLTKFERRILWNYEQEHGRLFPGAIEKVIEDEKEIRRSKKGKKKKC